MARKHIRNFRLSDRETKMKKIASDFADVIVRMISRDPSQRYQSFMEVEKDLLGILSDRISKAS